MLEFFMQVEDLRKKAVDLLAKVKEAEAEKERIFRDLLLKEAECERLKKERDRYKSLCKIKDIIIEGDKKCCRK